MPKSFLGVGWAFTADPNDPESNVGVRLNSAGAILKAEYEESVRQSISVILGTARGERVMRPDFGCGVYDLVFEPNAPATAGRISQEVRESLLLNEPRIDVRDVRVESRDNGETMLISIDYEVRATNNVFNLVYPFYLERSQS
ncbi:MAG TPA: GPW/gp25 family protein [Blastocatellia bacterium]|jgi:phage baseplate assembly protein W|nr:GPW/gp25 family protein [Blastocatellia bacterium]